MCSSYTASKGAHDSDDDGSEQVSYEMKGMVKLFSAATDENRDTARDPHTYLISFLLVAQASRSVDGLAAVSDCDLALRILTATIQQHSADSAQLKHWQALVGTKNMVMCLTSLFHEPQLMKSSWNLFCMLLEGGNVQVQEHIRQLLDEPHSTMPAFVQQVREELSHAVADLHNTTRNLQKAREERAQVILRHSDSEEDGSDANMWATPLPFSPTDRALFQWVLALLKGLQLFAEGPKKFLQDYMRGYRTFGTPSVNFVSQLAQEALLVHNHLT
jgi:hypothetical protein